MLCGYYTRFLPRFHILRKSVLNQWSALCFYSCYLTFDLFLALYPFYFFPVTCSFKLCPMYKESAYSEDQINRVSLFIIYFGWNYLRASILHNFYQHLQYWRFFPKRTPHNNTFTFWEHFCTKGSPHTNSHTFPTWEEFSPKGTST